MPPPAGEEEEEEEEEGWGVGRLRPDLLIHTDVLAVITFSIIEGNFVKLITRLSKACFGHVTTTPLRHYYRQLSMQTYTVMHAQARKLTHTHRVPMTMYVQTVAYPNHKLEQNTPTFRIVLLILGLITATPNN